MRAAQSARDACVGGSRMSRSSTLAFESISPSGKFHHPERRTLKLAARFDVTSQVQPLGPHQCESNRSHERAIGLVEVLVVLLITGILIGLGVWSITSARSAGRTVGTMTAAHAYGDAIERFARDHRGRFPGAPGTADWPGGADARRGPAANVLGTKRYFLRSIPESVQDGSVAFNGAGPATLRYRQLNGGSGYELIVSVTNRPPCAVRGGNTTGASPMNECGRR